MKTTRNCWECKRRNFWVCLGYVLLMILSVNTLITYIYRKMDEVSRGSISLTYTNMTEAKELAQKLKYEHLYMTSFSKMRVDLATQVCS